MSGATFVVAGGRPIAEIVLQIGARGGVIVTYEDPPYLHSPDLDDVTDEVSRDKDAVARGSRVFVPKLQHLTWKQPGPARLRGVEAVEASITHLLRTYDRAAAGSRFNLLRTGDVLHVVPSRARLADGSWSDVYSILDYRISVPDEPRAPSEQLDAIITALGQRLDIYIGVTNHPAFDMAGAKITAKVDNIPAREALLDVLQYVDRPTTWRIHYGPGVNAYFVGFGDAWPDVDVRSEPTEGAEPTP